MVLVVMWHLTNKDYAAAPQAPRRIILVEPSRINFGITA
jgi:hypothetical protein